MSSGLIQTARNKLHVKTELREGRYMMKFKKLDGDDNRGRNWRMLQKITEEKLFVRSDR